MAVEGGARWSETSQGGSDFGRDYVRDIGDEPPGDAPRHGAGRPRADRRGRAGQRPLPAPPTAGSVTEAPEHDWAAAATLIFPALRPAGTHGPRLDRDRRGRARGRGPTQHAQPLVDEGPAGLPVVYVLPPAASTSSSTPTTCWRGASSRTSSRTRRWRTSRAWSAERGLDRRARPASGGCSRPTPARAATPRGSCCPRSSSTSPASSAAAGAGPGRPARIATCSIAGSLAPGDDGVRGAVRGVRRRAVRRRGRADRPAGVRARRRPPRRVRAASPTTGLIAAADLRVEVADARRHDHARPAGRAERADRADEGGAARGVPRRRAATPPSGP